MSSNSDLNLASKGPLLERAELLRHLQTPKLMVEGGLWESLIENQINSVFHQSHSINGRLKALGF